MTPSNDKEVDRLAEELFNSQRPESWVWKDMPKGLQDDYIKQAKKVQSMLLKAKIEELKEIYPYHLDDAICVDERVEHLTKQLKSLEEKE